jgi:ribonuclease BN (tRNA processing enzyme)
VTTIRVLGCGDAFNSGGRFFPSFHVSSASATFLLDCGPTALLAMKRHDLDPDALDAVLISHFHGDHFGGLPFLELELAILRRRTRPLLIAGPPEVEQRVPAAMDAIYPATTTAERLRMEYVSWRIGEQVNVGSLRVRSFAAIHTAETKPHMLRIEVDSKIIAYSGDTEWTDDLIALAEGTDLLICESSTFALKVKNHLDYQTLLQHRNELRCGRLVLTHMSDEMLRQLPVETETATDGLVIRL